MECKADEDKGRTVVQKGSWRSEVPGGQQFGNGGHQPWLLSLWSRNGRTQFVGFCETNEAQGHRAGAGTTSLSEAGPSTQGAFLSIQGYPSPARWELSDSEHVLESCASGSSPVKWDNSLTSQSWEAHWVNPRRISGTVSGCCSVG